LGSLSKATPVDDAYARVLACTDQQARIAATTDLVLAVFDEFYLRFCDYSRQAKRAFETMDPHASIRISKERLDLYSSYISEHGPRIVAAFPALSDNAALWQAVEASLLTSIAERYEADIVFGFTHSLRRNIDHGIWRPVAYSFPPPGKGRVNSTARVFRRLPVRGRIDSALLANAFEIPEFSVPFRDLEGDSRLILQRLEQLLYASSGSAGPVALDVVKAGFFRDRSAFLVARWLMSDASFVPFVVAFLNNPDGVYADAVLHRVEDIHALFSSALANLHVTTPLYYQTCVFLFSLMPRRPLGHHYATIGYNHVGKVVILKEIVEQVRGSGEGLRRSPGMPGTVALGFTSDSCQYHMKVIRDHPTSSYKWGAFPGVASVVDKYRAIHEINRAASMLDNVMYFNVRLDRDLFEAAFLDELLQQAGGSVQIDADGVFIRFLIVQLKIVPLPLYLEQADASETETVIRSLGHCIRNNAATNIFNRDLDSRNYGVGRYGRVLLFDYDAVEKLTDVKIRTNVDREPGEEVPPDWFYEDGVIFLPEEIEYGLQLKSDWARRCFRKHNADLLTIEYWEGVQQKLVRGEVPELRMYPRTTKLVKNDYTSILSTH
jgi:isocitrate dehydrogenase kinase/phosphatase